MKNKGFTLAELLGVMVILSLISIITVPAVTESLNSHKTKLCNSQIDEIIAAAKIWGTENKLKLPDKEGESYTIDLETLAEYGYIDAKINNPVTNENFDLEDTVVTITRKGKRYTYAMDDNTINTCYSNGIKRPASKKTYPRVVYSRVNGATHVGYPIDAGKDMGSKYVWTESGVSIPFNSLEECNATGGSNEQCVASNFTTSNLDYKTSPDASWNFYLKHTLNSNGIIEEIDVCGKHNGQEFCLKRDVDGSKYEQNKTLLLNTFGNDICDVSSSDISCGDSSFHAGASANGLVYVRGNKVACDVSGGGTAACYGLFVPDDESSSSEPIGSDNIPS